MRADFSTRRLLSFLLVTFSGVCIILFASVAYLGLSKILSNFAWSRFNDYHELFVESIKTDLLMGREAEVFTRCFSQRDRPEIGHIKITTFNGRDICDFSKMGASAYTFRRAVYFDESENNRLATIEMSFIDCASPALRRSMMWYVFLILSTIILGSVFFARKLIGPYVSVLSNIAEQLEASGIDQWQFDAGQFPRGRSFELNTLVERLAEMAGKLRSAKRLEVDVERQRALGEQALQVSHDIRSPLSALNMLLSLLKDLPENQRVLLRQAVARINDIANTLLQRGQPVSRQERFCASEATMIAPLVDSIVSEKRIQCMNIEGVSISVDLSDAFGLFAFVEPSELKRCLSNLINNSIEALSDRRGLIKIKIEGRGQFVVISISDDGIGIPDHVVRQLNMHFGDRGLSFGKTGSNAGFGLGIRHGRDTMAACGGSLWIDSMVGKGTRVTLSLPKARPPVSFPECIAITTNQSVVILDDDDSVRELWKIRFAKILQSNAVTLHTFRSTGDFEAWVKTNDRTDTLFLIDYELLGDAGNGLDLVESLNLIERTILVTSRYEDVALKQRVASMGNRMLPKSMAAFIPIKLSAPEVSITPGPALC